MVARAWELQVEGGIFRLAAGAKYGDSAVFDGGFVGGAGAI